jgi:hypothetical protein
MRKVTRGRTSAQKARARAAGRGTARAAFDGALRFDNGVPARVTARDLEAYFDDAWRVLGSGKDWSD